MQFHKNTAFRVDHPDCPKDHLSSTFALSVSSEAFLSPSVMPGLRQKTWTQKQLRFFYIAALNNVHSFHCLCRGSTQNATQVKWGKKTVHKGALMDSGEVQHKGKQVRSEPKYKGLGVWKTKFGLSVAEHQFSVKVIESVNLRENRESLQHRTSGKTFDIMWLLTYFEKTVYLLFIYTMFREIWLCITCLYINIIIIFPKPVRSWTLVNHLALDGKSPSQVKVTDHMKPNTNKGS